MRRVAWAATACLVLAASLAHADDAGSVVVSAGATPPPAIPAAGATPPPRDLLVKGHGKSQLPTDFRFQLGDPLTLEATGAVAKALRAELAKPLATSSIILHLDGIAMEGLRLISLDLRGDAGVEVTFLLARDGNSDDNRHAWDALLERQNDYEMDVPVSVAIGHALPIGAGDPDTIRFQIASPDRVRFILVTGLVLFLGIFAVLVHVPFFATLLKDGGTPYYSLGKAQMAFWGILVFLTVGGIFIITGSVEHIPNQTLTLLGISSATGLGAALMGRTKNAHATADTAALIAEQAQLTAEQAVAPAIFPVEKSARLTVIATQLARPKITPDPSKGFFADICDDGTGLSFHRVQVILWTALLGCVFVHSVAQVMSMPEFPDSLLLLMGISNGTYLGFKVPEPA